MRSAFRNCQSPALHALAMSASLRESIYEAIASIRLIDPHTHINPHAPASDTLADLLGYHYYTELAHSAGMPKAEIEEPGLDPRELVGRLVRNLGPIENTAQYRWLVEICRNFFGFDGDRIDESNWETIYDSAERQMRMAEWPQMVLDQSNVQAVFLTNDFDDDLAGFDTDTYIPCLRTDDLVFHLGKHEVRERLSRCTGIELDGSLGSLRESLNQRFEHFVSRGARACAISIPPSFEPSRVSDGRAETALSEVLRKGVQADPSHLAALSKRVFWTLAELCDQYRIPFDLMIGVNRGVYADGVFQGQDLYDSRVSLIQYKELFNAFPEVKFPVSVLASVTNQELVSYAWIFPNVITNGHWWYSNTPSFIARDAAARLEAVPQTKQIAYYSDAYKLEFVWPKFDMYRRILSGILADQFVINQGWSEERAVELARQVLRDNVDEIFPPRSESSIDPKVDPLADTWVDDPPQPSDQGVDHEPADTNATWTNPVAAASSAALAAGAIGMLDVSDAAESETDDSPEPPAELEESRNDGSGDGFATQIEPMEPPEDLPTAIEEAHEASVEEHEPLTQEDFPTVVETAETQLETVTEDILESDQGHSVEALQELPTMLDTEDTVRIEEEESAPDIYETLADSTTGDSPVQAFSAPEIELDPVPNAEEIQAVEVDDVQLDDFGAERSVPDADALAEQIDPEPLDVGDLNAGESSGEEIQMLRGEESFSPDEESLQLQADPVTGELTLPIEADSDDEGMDLELAEPAGPDLDDTIENVADLVSDVTEPPSGDARTADQLILDAAEDMIDNGQDALNETIEIDESPDDDPSLNL
ncbi:MAG: glucuronate isomerase [Rubripirellula sp.]